MLLAGRAKDDWNLWDAAPSPLHRAISSLLRLPPVHHDGSDDDDHDDDDDDDDDHDDDHDDHDDHLTSSAG